MTLGGGKTNIVNKSIGAHTGNEKSRSFRNCFLVFFKIKEQKSTRDGSLFLPPHKKIKLIDRNKIISKNS